ncbi:MAG: hypothetical protein IJ391_08935 [Clostridia bacterium]|nr:hypothetical protein [Clostridia bacterium]
MKISGITKHSFVCTDTAAQKLIWIDENGNTKKEICNVKGCFDLWITPDGRILYSHFGGSDGDGFTVLNEDGSLHRKYNTKHEIFSCQPLENGNILVGELGQKRIVEVDTSGNIVLEIPIPYEGSQHECMRMVRKYGNYYFAVQPGLNIIRKLTRSGETIKEYSVRPDAFGVAELANGNVIYTCMSGAYELDAQGKEVWALTDADVPGINIRWLLGLQVLSNDNIVFSNWMGHGHLDEGIHFFEVDREKRVIWTFDGRGTLMMPAALHILD